MSLSNVSLATTLKERQMFKFFTISLFLIGSMNTKINTAFAESSTSIEVRCSFTITRDGKVPYILNGMVQSFTGQDYLTLEPAITSGAKFSARILLTDEEYHPVTIHPRGDTAEYTVFADLAKNESVELRHIDEGNKSTYFLSCKNTN
jgi:hypothetical protein